MGSLAQCEGAACREADGHQYVAPPGKTLAASSPRLKPTAGRHQDVSARRTVQTRSKDKNSAKRKCKMHGCFKTPSLLLPHLLQKVLSYRCGQLDKGESDVFSH